MNSLWLRLFGNDPYPGYKYVALEAINKIFKGEEDNGKEMEQID